MYKRCLEHEPNNIEVARAIRLINTRAEKAKKSGGLISNSYQKSRFILLRLDCDGSALSGLKIGRLAFSFLL